jgi:hypothetical protein
VWELFGLEFEERSPEATLGSPPRYTGRCLLNVAAVPELRKPDRTLQFERLWKYATGTYEGALVPSAAAGRGKGGGKGGGGKGFFKPRLHKALVSRPLALLLGVSGYAKAAAAAASDEPALVWGMLPPKLSAYYLFENSPFQAKDEGVLKVSPTRSRRSCFSAGLSVEELASLLPTRTTALP